MRERQFRNLAMAGLTAFTFSFAKIAEAHATSPSGSKQPHGPLYTPDEAWMNGLPGSFDVYRAYENGQTSENLSVGQLSSPFGISAENLNDGNYSELSKADAESVNKAFAEVGLGMVKVSEASIIIRTKPGSFDGQTPGTPIEIVFAKGTMDIPYPDGTVKSDVLIPVGFPTIDGQSLTLSRKNGLLRMNAKGQVLVVPSLIGVPPENTIQSFTMLDGRSGPMNKDPQEHPIAIMMNLRDAYQNGELPAWEMMGVWAKDDNAADQVTEKVQKDAEVGNDFIFPWRAPVKAPSGDVASDDITLARFTMVKDVVKPELTKLPADLSTVDVSWDTGKITDPKVADEVRKAGKITVAIQPYPVGQTNFIRYVSPEGKVFLNIYFNKDGFDVFVQPDAKFSANIKVLKIFITHAILIGAREKVNKNPYGSLAERQIFTDYGSYEFEIMNDADLNINGQYPSIVSLTLK